MSIWSRSANLLAACCKRETRRQLIKYAAVGLMSNLCGYVVYLLATSLGGTPKLTMTVLYVVASTAGFFMNKTMTFRHKGDLAGAAVRYAVAYGGGYLLNLGILTVFVDKFGYPHQAVQAIAILVVAAFLFLALRFYAFGSSA
ncbi:hypothetical protein AKI39_23580 [Bordetella sp. H567]|uniref:GtrA family protein n=1 Tax=Bordetella sp. H567 TaxID=1697043 RepID=UPI00081C91BF|nr:GtrA family protein [Bordetella sp. H567]AOB33984.1 hypothetical protein AKI39_23580 [Bordetella sp. H567]